MKPFNCTEQVIDLDEQICMLMIGNICNFSKRTVSIQMVRYLLLINQILQVWYQNEEDIHVLLIGLIYETFLEELDF